MAIRTRGTYLAICPFVDKLNLIPLGVKAILLFPTNSNGGLQTIRWLYVLLPQNPQFSWLQERV